MEADSSGAGATGQKNYNRSKRREKEIGEMLDEGDAAPKVVGEATLEEATTRANEKLKKEVRADAKDIARAIDKA